jgi:hypothetical protein
MEHKKGNQQIHIYMGWEMMSNQEIFDYNHSPYNLSRNYKNVDEWVKNTSNLPDMKRKGSIITHISHNDVFYSDLLSYQKSMDSLMPVLEKITKEYYKYDDMFYTIKELLKGEDEKELSFSVQNIWIRIVKLIIIINKNNKNFIKILSL